MQVGSLVVLVKNDQRLLNLREIGNTIPAKDVVYTVRDVETVIVHNEAVLCIRLEEIINKPQKFRQGIGECVFPAELFAEIQPPQKINISELLEEPAAV